MMEKAESEVVLCSNNNCDKILARLGYLRGEPAIFLWCKTCHNEIGYTLEGLLSRLQLDAALDDKSSELRRMF